MTDNKVKKNMLSHDRRCISMYRSTVNTNKITLNRTKSQSSILNESRTIFPWTFLWHSLIFYYIY